MRVLLLMRAVWLSRSAAGRCRAPASRSAAGPWATPRLVRAAAAVITGSGSLFRFSEAASRKNPTVIGAIADRREPVAGAGPRRCIIRPAAHPDGARGRAGGSRRRRRLPVPAFGQIHHRRMHRGGRRVSALRVLSFPQLGHSSVDRLANMHTPSLAAPDCLIHARAHRRRLHVSEDVAWSASTAFRRVRRRRRDGLRQAFSDQAI